jgi:hypothetical protein
VLHPRLRVRERAAPGVLYDDAGERVHVLNGATEEPLVRGLADPTVDVTVAHGWAQAPEELRARWGPGAKRHR